MTHPTPAELKAAIHDALAADFEKNGYSGQVPFIPARVHRLVDKAISDTCDRKGNQ